MKTRWILAALFVVLVAGFFVLSAPQADALQDCGPDIRSTFDPITVSCGGSPRDCLETHVCG